LDLGQWLIYTFAILILTATPGPSILLCLTKSISQGFNASVYTALGSLTAIVGIMTLSFTGLGVVIASSELVFNVIKWSGVAYLIYLGVRLLVLKSDNFDISVPDVNATALSKANLFGSGFLVGATNPKAIVFFTALFPQFIDTTRPLLTQFFVLVSTFAVLELGWLLVYAYFGARSSHWLMAEGRAKYFNKLTGGVFVGAGVILSTTDSSLS